MKTLRTILAAVAILFGAMTMNAQRMSYDAMCNNARFLTDRMAYELGIRSMAVIDDLYRINYDYIYGVNDYLDEVAYGYHYDDYMAVCAQRDYALRRLLGDLVWDRLIRYNYFYRPIVFANRGWHFSIYDYDRHGFNHYFYGVPHHYRVYTGGHYFRGMAPRGGHIDMRRGVAPHAGSHVEPHRTGNMGGNMHRGNEGGNMRRGDEGGHASRGNMGERTNSNMGGNEGMRPQGNMNERPQNNGGIRTQGNGGRSDNNNRSSSRVGGTSRGDLGGASRGGSVNAPTRSGATRGGGNMSTPSRGNSGNMGGGTRGGSNGGNGGPARGGRR